MQDSNPYVHDDEYAAEWASVIDDAVADPADGLDDLLAIVDRILEDETGSRSTADLEPELGRRLDYAREIVRGLERGDDIETGDIDAALSAVISVYNATLPVGAGKDPGSVDPVAADQLDIEMGAGDTGESQTDP
jgi:hypothetical protein